MSTKGKLYNRKQILTILTLLLIGSNNALGQNKPDNYSFFKFVIFNRKNEVLLMTYQGAWEVPGRKYQGSTSIKTFLAETARSFSIADNQWRLNGLFTFHFAEKPNPTIMHYYSTVTATDQPTCPVTGEKVQWFCLSNAKKVIPYREMREILSVICKQPTVVFGGSYDITGKGAERRSAVKDSLFTLNGVVKPIQR